MRKVGSGPEERRSRQKRERGSSDDERIVAVESWKGMDVYTYREIGGER
jgi:hypothetical protein